jgi:hypothetical protein
MQKRGTMVVVILTLVAVGLMVAPPPIPFSARASAPNPSSPVAPVAAAGPAALPHVAVVARAPAAPTMTFPRTVLIETATAQWCVWCGLESQALFQVEHQYPRSSVVIAELHSCSGEGGGCGDNYVPADGTSTTRDGFYRIAAFPTVVFDGTHSAVGDPPGETVAANLAEYDSMIVNATHYPGNMSIVQTASITSSTSVSVYANITSGLTGNYTVWSYIEEYIGKNITEYSSTVHDLGYVVRGTAIDKLLPFTAGTTTSVSGSLALSPGWNQQNLTAVTFVQFNNTKTNVSKTVENANMVPVSTLLTDLTTGASNASAQAPTTVTVRVMNGSTGQPVSGALVRLASSVGGTFSPAGGTTPANGTLVARFTAPLVTAQETATLYANVSAAGYVSSTETQAIVINPVMPPSAPQSLSDSLQNLTGILLNWSAPATGGGGVTYHVYRSGTQTGVYDQLATTAATSYVDSSLASGRSYWYKVSAANVGGFSSNSTATTATAVVASTQGLPTKDAWWITVNTMTFNSSTASPISFHLPAGEFEYTAGPYSSVYEAPDGSGAIAAAGTTVPITVTFQPNWALLTGSVSPVNATVTLDGTPLAVTAGGFLQKEIAGTYTLVATAQGYVGFSKVVTLTPGNTTNVPITLTLNQTVTSPGPTSSNSGFNVMAVGLVIVVVVVILGVVGVVLMMRRRKGGAASAPPAASPPTQP